MPAQNAIELNNFLNREVSEGRMSLETARSRWAANNKIIDDAWNQRLKDQAKDHEIRKERARISELERIRDESYKNQLTEADKLRIAREKASRLENERNNAERLRQENLKNNQPPPWRPSGTPDVSPSGTGNGGASNDTISGRNDRSFVPSGGNSGGGGGSGRPSGTGSSSPAPTGKSQTQTPVLTPDRPPVQSPWGGSTEPGGKIVKSGGLGGINQPVNPRGNGSPATPTPNSPNYGASQPPRSATGSSFGGAAGVGIADAIARQDAERERSRRERQAIADSQTPEQREQRANDHLEKYKDSFGGPRDYTYPPGYNNTVGTPDFDRLVQDANRYRERNGMPPIGGNGAAGIGRGGIGGGAAGIGGAAGQIGRSANPNWFSPSDPNQPWNAPYDPYKAIDPATGLPWIERDKMPQMPSYPRPMAPIFQHPDGTPMPLTPDGRPIGPDGVPLWPPGDPNVPPIPGWIPPTPPDPNTPEATDSGMWFFNYSYGGPGAGTGPFESGIWSTPGAQNNPPYFGSTDKQYHLYQSGKIVYANWVGVSNPPSMSGLQWIPPAKSEPKRDPAPQPFIPAQPSPAPGTNPVGNPVGSPAPSGAPVGSVAPGSSPDGSLAPALAPSGSPQPAPGRMPGFSPLAPTMPFAPPSPRPSPPPAPSPGRNPQRDPGPQPIGGSAPDPSPSPSPSGNPFGSPSRSDFRGGADPSGSPSPTPTPNPNPNPAPGGGSGTGTGSPPTPPKECRYPTISSVSVDIFDGFDDAGEPKKKSQAIACLPDAVERVRVTFARLYEIESKKPSGGVALPEAWAVRKGTDRPQLVIVYAEIFSSGKLGSSRWSLTVPHYRGTEKSKISAPNYKRGNWQGQLTLNDGSTIVVNAASSEECKRSLNKLKILVPNDYRITKEGKAIKPRVVENPNLDLKSCNVTAVSAKYYATGQKDMAPTWAKSLRS